MAKKSEQFDILLQPHCKSSKSIWNGYEGKPQEKSKAASKFSQQGGEGVEENLIWNKFFVGFGEL